MKIILFGSSGMLGNYMKSYLGKIFEVCSFTRDHFDIESSNWQKLNDLLDMVIKDGDVIINCAGAIPQRTNDNRYFIILNTIFPIKLNEYVKKKNVKLIHITTDCVFSGNDGNYNEISPHDSEKIYGITKSLSEEYDMCVIRTSIIGDEKKNKNSLIEWVKKNRNGQIDGYANFYWNGVTCLTLSKIVEIIIKNNEYWNGVRHIFSPEKVSKYELCCYINEIYKLNININKIDYPIKNMTLDTIYKNRLSLYYKIPDIKTQILEQYNYPLSQNEQT